MSSNRSSGRPSSCARFTPFGADLDPGDRGTGLDAPLKLQQLDVQVHGFGQFRLEGLETLEFGDFSRFGARRGSAWFWHALDSTTMGRAP